MSDDPDFEMEVVKNENLDSNGSKASSEPSDSEVRRVESAGEAEDGKGTEVSSVDQSVPEDWEMRKLRDLLSYEVSGTWGDDPEDGEGKPVLRATNFAPNTIDLEEVALRKIPDSHRDSKRLKKGDIVLERSGGSADQPTGRVLFFELDGEYYPGNFLRLLRPDLETINRRFLYYCLDYRYRRGDTIPIQTNSTNIRNLQYTSYLNLDVHSPPLPEQRKIASVLYTVDQAIQKTKEIIEQTKITKKGVLRKLYREGLRESEVNHTPAGDTPVNWGISTLENICSIGGGSTPSKKNESFWGGEILWVSPKDFLGTEIQNTEDKLTKEGVEQSNLKVYPEGSTLIVVRSGILRRRLPIAKASRPTAVNQDIKVVAPKDEEIDEEYLFQILHSHASRVRRNCMKVGTTVESIETSLLQKFPIKVPPLKDQKRIAAIGSDFDRELKVEREKLTSLKLLKKGLMQDLLTGEVRTADRAIEVLEEVQAHG